ncbi:MAG: 4-alpha-glucanotransferase [Timaviella obliquedivisa GSE-PSE-MK23-08B]|nr:4-alpha-glucanotransferase [Timaviella obliquedivisa GSE-PSE-MK23-08B]
MTFQRASGILLHPTCLPSRFGIGDLGQSAYEFIDFLERSGQKLWQVLPLGPTGDEHSPYIMNYSAFAGNPMLLSLDVLAGDQLLHPDELAPLPEAPADRVDFDRVIPHKSYYLKLAYNNFKQRNSQAEFEQFCEQKAVWLDDFALFMALLEANNGKAWNVWEGAIARREPAALAAQREQLQDEILYQKFLQFKFFGQWSNLRNYAQQKNIQIVGDVSIYVCHNSAEVWGNPEIFKLDPQTLEPAYIAGVPPDYFSATGQLWGNPVYNWDKLQATNFAWWIERFKATMQYVDIVRIDHFRGFEAYWQVRAGETTAMNGEWVKAPGVEFFEALAAELGNLPVMAEDLGIITPEVENLRDRFQFPGMRILQFAFTGDPDHAYLPHNYVPNSVVYPGTHDNDTAIGWWTSAAAQEKQQFAQYLGYDRPEDVSEINWALIRMALASVSDLAILPLQDLLGLGSSGRMNDPSVNAGQWRWRYESSEQLNQEMSDRLGWLTRLYGR